MRYILLCISLFFLTYNVTAQLHDLQNANWQFGTYADITFLPNTLAPTSIGNNVIGSFEGFASVSDQAGNLVFYTNGADVINKNLILMPHGTGLLGSSSSTQGAIIVPKPQGKIYYIITTSGSTGSNPYKGLRYSEVDITLDSGLGDVIDITKNTPLEDHNNIPIDDLYGSASEKVTATKHCNGEDYWVISQIGNYVYSYIVTSNGLNVTPVSYTLAPVNIIGHKGMGQMKVSLNGKRLGISYNSDFNAGSGSIAMADFNNSTGEVTFDNNLITISNGNSYYGLEFSALSKYCYFNCDGVIYRVDAENPSAIETIFDTSRVTSSMQLAINGKIYICVKDDGVSYSHNLSVINEPDSVSSPDFQLDDLTIPYGNVYHGLPQLVPWQNNCSPYTTLTDPEIIYIPYTYKYSESITTSTNYTVKDGQHITMEAGDFIELLPNTSIEEGADYSAIIKECGGCDTPSGRPAKINMGAIEDSKLDINTNKTDLTLFPNPAKDFTEISYLNGINSIIVTSIDGKVVYQGQVNDNKYILDTKTYNKGIYLISIQTNEGNIITKKLVIN